MATENPAVQAQAQAIPVSITAISAQHLTKKFGDVSVVRDISFEVPRASIFGFIGPSGSGKTTTLRLLTGSYLPTEGSIKVLNNSPTKFSKSQRARIGYMPQLFVLYPNLTVWENLNFVASIYGMSLFRHRRLQQILEFVELYEHRDKLARQISGGMQRRLSLAAALIHDPDLLFLDEPTAGIDPILRAKFWERFKELQSVGRTLFITTQYVNEAEYCDLVGVMAKGKVVMIGTPTKLRRVAYGGEIIDVHTTEPIDYKIEHLLGSISLKTIRTGPNSMRLIVNQASTEVPELLAWAQQNNVQVESLEQYRPPFEDVFVELLRSEVNDG